MLPQIDSREQVFVPFLGARALEDLRASCSFVCLCVRRVRCAVRVALLACGARPTHTQCTHDRRLSPPYTLIASSSCAHTTLLRVWPLPWPPPHPRITVFVASRFRELGPHADRPRKTKAAECEGNHSRRVRTAAWSPSGRFAATRPTSCGRCSVPGVHRNRRKETGRK